MDNTPNYRTIKSGKSINMIGENQVLIMVPIPPQRTVESIAKQPQPKWQYLSTPGGSVADQIEKG